MRRRVGTMVLSIAASTLSMALPALFVARVGLGVDSDRFFGALALAQFAATVMFAPYDLFLIGAFLRPPSHQRPSVRPYVGAWLWQSLPLGLLVAVVGPGLLGPLFGSGYSSDAAAWRQHALVLALAVPLSGVYSILQTYCQAREYLDLPKIALVAGRLAGLLVFLLMPLPPIRLIAPAFVLSYFVAIVWMVVGLQREPAPTGRGPTAAEILAEWRRLAGWTLLNRTDQFIDRVLSARLASGFLTAFNLAFAIVMAVVEAFSSSFVAGDAARASGGESRRVSLDDFSGSTRAARMLTLAAAAGAAGALWAGERLPMLAERMGALAMGERAWLAASMVLLLYFFLQWRQLIAVYALRGASRELARLALLLYLGFLPVRLLSGLPGSSAVFLAVLTVYYATQMWLLRRRIALGTSALPLRAL